MPVGRDGGEKGAFTANTWRDTQFVYRRDVYQSTPKSDRQLRDTLYRFSTRRCSIHPQTPLLNSFSLEHLLSTNIATSMWAQRDIPDVIGLIFYNILGKFHQNFLLACFQLVKIVLFTFFALFPISPQSSFNFTCIHPTASDSAWRQYFSTHIYNIFV